MLPVDLPTRADIEDLLQARGPAHVTIYLPTSPITQETQGDRIALKNLTNTALGQLAEHDKREVQAIEELLLDVIDDDAFWVTQANSLALFVTPTRLRTFRLPTRLQPIAEVSDRFYIKPLLRVMTVPQSAFVLALAQNSVRVVEVSADLPAFEVTVTGMPKDAASAVGKASIAGRSPLGRIQGSEGMKVRLNQYARAVDQALRDLLGGRETPLILAATEPLLSIYRLVQSYPYLAPTAIASNPEAMTDGELAAAARTILDELFQQELAQVRALFEQRQSQHRTTTDVAQAARAATQGAIQKLLIDIDAVLPGTVDEQGTVTFAQEACPASYEILDEIAGLALLTGARVLGVRRDEIPGGGSLAAILRYPV